MQNLLLAARSAGLGAALITLPLWSTWSARRSSAAVERAAVRRDPDRLAAGRYGPTTRRPVGEVVSLDRYGHRPWKGSPGS